MNELGQVTLSSGCGFFTLKSNVLEVCYQASVVGNRASQLALSSRQEMHRLKPKSFKVCQQALWELNGRKSGSSK